MGGPSNAGTIVGDLFLRHVYIQVCVPFTITITDVMIIIGITIAIITIIIITIVITMTISIILIAIVIVITVLTIINALLQPLRQDNFAASSAYLKSPDGAKFAIKNMFVGCDTVFESRQKITIEHIETKYAEQLRRGDDHAEEDQDDEDEDDDEEGAQDESGDEDAVAVSGGSGTATASSNAPAAVKAKVG